MIDAILILATIVVVFFSLPVIVAAASRQRDREP